MDRGFGLLKKEKASWAQEVISLFFLNTDGMLPYLSSIMSAMMDCIPSNCASTPNPSSFKFSFFSGICFQPWEKPFTFLGMALFLLGKPLCAMPVPGIFFLPWALLDQSPGIRCTWLLVLEDCQAHRVHTSAGHSQRSLLFCFRAFSMAF